MYSSVCNNVCRKTQTCSQTIAMLGHTHIGILQSGQTVSPDKSETAQCNKGERQKELKDRHWKVQVHYGPYASFARLELQYGQYPQKVLLTIVEERVYKLSGC